MAPALLCQTSNAAVRRGTPCCLQLSDGQMVFSFQPAVQLGVKLAGVHWWFKSRSHAAELTAGYYNPRELNGYRPILEVLAKNGACVNFTCVEMRDCEHPPESKCSPQGLLTQVSAALGSVGAGEAWSLGGWWAGQAGAAC
jgi:beta-amylase